MDKFVWDEGLQKGYYPVDEALEVYNQSYFDKYKSYENTDIGREINDFRINFVNFFTNKDSNILDIGIGSGFFLNNRPNTYGFDVNPVAIAMLKERGLYINPYEENLLDKDISGVTCFDSFEHIKHPEGLLYEIPSRAFFIVSIPIFANKEHALKSKHFRPDEHYHYFTNVGFIAFMKDNGFHLLWTSNTETKLGRDEIYTYSFQKG